MPDKPTYEELENRSRAFEIENTLLKQETTHLNLFKSTVEASSDAIGISTAKGYHWYQNKAFDELFGDVGNTPPATLYVDEKVGREVFETIMAGQEWIGDVLMNGRNGEILNIHLRAYSFKDKDGKVIGLVGVHTDITRQKLVEKALTQSEVRLQKAQSVAKIGSWEYDFSTGEIWGSTEAVSIMGIDSRSSTLPLSYVETLIVEKEGVQQTLQRIIEKNKTYDFTFQAKRESDGKEIWLHLVAERIREDNGQFKVLGVIQDVTEKIKTDEERDRIWRMLDAAISQSPSGIIIADAPDVTIRIANAEALRIRGKTDQPLTEIDVRQHAIRWQTLKTDGTPYPPKELPLSRAILKGESTKNEEVIIRDEDGRDHLVSVNAAPIYDTEDRITAGIVIFHDITDYKQTVKALSVSRERMNAIFKATPDPIVVYNREGHPEYINPTFTEVFGWTYDELKGKQIPFVPDDQKNITIGAINQLYQTEIPARVETTRLTKDGKILDVLISGLVIKGIEGEHAGIVVNITDMTERKKQAAQFQQAQKMEAIGTLAGGIAHDFNNILGAVTGYSELALYKAKDGRPNRGDLEKVLKAARRATDLVQQILNFSRQAEQEIRAVYIVPIINEALKLLRASLPTTIEIQQEMDAPIGKINADSTQIHQIIMNLCTNAAHAMLDKGGILRITLQEIDQCAVDASVFPELEPGRYQRLSVSDTGYGIEKNDMDRIFDPFFTTKEKGEGTGMGLAVVHGIIKSYGGAISVDSEPGKGSTFNIFLPVDASVDSTTPIEVKETPLPTGNEHILLVDDEDTLVDIGKQMIENLGYQVTAIQSSTAALEAFKAEPERFDLVITDQTMPKITGIQLAHEMLLVKPTLPIILCTGYSAQLSEEIIKKIGIKRMIMKPILVKEIAVAIRELLD
jgi:PAS domain S-box-containing protein